MCSSPPNVASPRPRHPARKLGGSSRSCYPARGGYSAWQSVKRTLGVLLDLLSAPSLGKVALGRLPVSPSGRVSVEVEAHDSGWLRVGGASRFVSGGGQWIFRALPGSEVRVVYRTLVGTASTTVLIPSASLPSSPPCPVVRVPQFRVGRTHVPLRPAVPAPRVRRRSLPRLPEDLARERRPLLRVQVPQLPALAVRASDGALAVAFGQRPPLAISRHDREALVALGAALVEQHLQESTAP